MQIDNDVLYRENVDQLPMLIFPVLSNFRIMTFLAMIFRKTVQTRVVIFGKQVDNDVLYRGIANQPSHVYSSLYLSDFLSVHIWNNELLMNVS